MQRRDFLGTSALTGAGVLVLPGFARNVFGAIDPTPGFYTAGGGLGSDWVTQYASNPNNHTSEGSLVLDSEGTPYVAYRGFQPQPSGVGFAMITKWDKNTKTWHGLQWPGSPADAVFGGGVRDVRVVMRSDDRPILAWQDQVGSVWVSQWENGAWRSFTGGTYPWDQVNCELGGNCHISDSFDIAVDPMTNYPVFVWCNSDYVYARKWDGTQFRGFQSASLDYLAYDSIGPWAGFAHTRIKCAVNGTPHVIWSGSSMIGQPAPVGHAYFNGSNWTQYGSYPGLLPGASKGYIDLAIDGYGRPHVVGEYITAGYADVWYTHHTASGWIGRTTALIDVMHDGSTHRDFHPTLAVGALGYADIVWYDELKAQIVLARWNSTSKAWEGILSVEPTVVSNDLNRTNWRPAVVFDSKRRPHVAYTVCVQSSSNCEPSNVRYTHWLP
jgi:hypothetical protein